MRRTMIVLSLAAFVGIASGVGSADEPEAKKLFNGECLQGWKGYLVEDDVTMKDVWSVKDGILVCKGEPMGYLYTANEYKNFKLVVEWRWPEGQTPGNSGVLLRITGPNAPLPKCVEGQLKYGSAGDIWAFKGFQCKGDEGRFRTAENPALGKFMGLSKIKDAEKKPGEWNKYEITLLGDKLTLVVNGETVNEATGCDEVAGTIGLQSEGGEIQFRTVELTPIEE